MHPTSFQTRSSSRIRSIFPVYCSKIAGPLPAVSLSSFSPGVTILCSQCSRPHRPSPELRANPSSWLSSHFAISSACLLTPITLPLVPELPTLPHSLGAPLPNPNRLFPDVSLAVSSDRMGGEDGGLVSFDIFARCACSRRGFGCALDPVDVGPIATNNSPHDKARITITPCDNCIVIMLRSFSAAVLVLEIVDSDVLG